MYNELTIQLYKLIKCMHVFIWMTEIMELCVCVCGIGIHNLVQLEYIRISLHWSQNNSLTTFITNYLQHAKQTQKFKLASRDGRWGRVAPDSCQRPLVLSYPFTSCSISASCRSSLRWHQLPHKKNTSVSHTCFTVGFLQDGFKFLQ